MRGKADQSYKYIERERKIKLFLIYLGSERHFTTKYGGKWVYKKNRIQLIVNVNKINNNQNYYYNYNF